MKLKRFLMFAFDTYYPGGGWEDFKGSFSDLEEAEAWLEDEHKQNGMIVDSETGKSVVTFGPLADYL